MQQAKSYAETLDLLFVYATNGRGILEFDRSTGLEREIDAFPSPKELWNRYRAANDSTRRWRTNSSSPITSLSKSRATISRSRSTAPSRRSCGKRRVLLTLATGIGQDRHRFPDRLEALVGAGGTSGRAPREPRILYLADRAVLVNDPKDKTFAPFGDARWQASSGGRVNKGREMYFATYQALAGDEGAPGSIREFAPDFFDLIIVDECHRGSARDDRELAGDPANTSPAPCSSA